MVVRPKHECAMLTPLEVGAECLVRAGFLLACPVPFTRPVSPGTYLRVLFC